jgi:hypothetical protein
MTPKAVRRALVPSPLAKTPGAPAPQSAKAASRTSQFRQ